ncbi:hypothetical protein PTSG_00430 [Salpingoeca rosetta]|uniref:CAP-Gly domain-containing protein n=1 Tax=Salpingoeca rosetta (strain ATCC 50818 / BSB-021) TaxID=946362 RepID=F2TWG4_SALR5|nr:uncharacterized protein PTSG_00430 [Salpingoeca rosetta]EGD72410.1 hypothetical protein PTSG_00430 [Salpingoeca rosetta]|eukprot:XP_004998979.1 hypothetical protein PTSG_00430 [Salpingoeca rosetta]
MTRRLRSTSGSMLPPLDERQRPSWNFSTDLHNSNGTAQSPCRCSTCRSIHRHSRRLEKKQRSMERLPKLPFKVGDRVLVTGDRVGLVRWVGRLDTPYINPNIHVGVHLDDPIGDTDGVLKGKRYFSCPEQHGVFVSKDEVILAKGRHDLNYKMITPPDKARPAPPLLPPVNNNATTTTTTTTTTTNGTYAQKPATRTSSAATRRRLHQTQRQLAAERAGQVAQNALKNKPWRGYIPDESDADAWTGSEDDADDGGDGGDDSDSDDDVFVTGVRGPSEDERATKELLGRVDDQHLKNVQESVLQRARDAERLLADLELRNNRRSPAASHRQSPSQPRSRSRSRSRSHSRVHSPHRSRNASARTGNGRGAERNSKAPPSPGRLSPHHHQQHQEKQPQQKQEREASPTPSSSSRARSRSRSPRPRNDRTTGAGRGDERGTKGAEQPKKVAAERGARAKDSANAPAKTSDDREKHDDGGHADEQPKAQGQDAELRQNVQAPQQQKQKQQASATTTAQNADGDNDKGDDDMVSADELVRDLFAAADVNNNGYLNALEFAHAAYTETLGLALTAGQEAQMMEAVDTTGNGRVTLDEMQPLFVNLLAHVYGDAQGDEWQLVYSRPPYEVHFHKPSASLDIQLPQDVDDYHRQVYAPPQNEIDLTALYAFHAGDTTARGSLAPDELVAVLSSPDLGLNLSQEDLDYVVAVTELEAYGEVAWPHFRLAMRVLMAREWFEALPPGAEWIRVDSEQFGTVFYHRETGEARYDEPEQYATY